MLKWEYYEENIGTDKTVATLFTKDGRYVLDVIEERKGYYTRPFKKFIQPYFIYYSSLSKELEQEDVNKRLKERLITGCKKVQENCEMQIKDLAEEINKLI